MLMITMSFILAFMFQVVQMFSEKEWGQPVSATKNRGFLTPAGWKLDEVMK